MMGTREQMKGGDEYDALTKRGRRSLALFRHSGIAARTKRRFWKRVRKNARCEALLAANERMPPLCS
jgi:hypothetical protein